MKRLVSICLVLLLLAAVAAAQSATSASHTVLIMPFENISKAPGLDWIGEAFPEVLGQRLAQPGLFIVPREDRLYAFDRAGIPPSVRASHAALFRIGEQMDVHYLIIGRYNFDGRDFTAVAQVLDVRQLRLSDEFTASGPLPKLLDIQNDLAWDLLRWLRPDLPLTRAAFLESARGIRLDAFEAYIRGLTVPARQDKIRYFREAVRLDPAYTLAMLQLGRTYFAARDYESAATWLSRIPRSDALAREASFFAGLAYFYTADYERAESAFTYLASLFPLTEVYNNLAVVQARRGKPAAVETLQKAIATDPNDPDYHFNLAVILYRAGHFNNAARQLRETLALQPTDREAQTLLDAALARTVLPPARVPPERLKHDYNESAYLQLALVIKNANEERLSKTDPRSHAAYYVEHGQQMLAQNFTIEAGQDFHEAVSLDPANAAAHAGLAAVLAATNDPAGARRECQAALKLQPSAAAYLVLARLEIADNNPQAAALDLDQALALDPANAAAAALKRDLAAPKPDAAGQKSSSPER